VEIFSYKHEDPAWARVASYPRILRYFLAEKQLTIPIRHVDLLAHENLRPEMLAFNPARTVPCAKLDDGRVVTGTLPLIEYIEECHADPPLIGTTPEQRAVVRSWMRLADEKVVSRGIRIYKLLASSYEGIESQDPAVARWQFEEVRAALAWFDTLLADRMFLVDDRFSAADVVLIGGVDQVQTLVFTLLARGHENTDAFRLDVANTWRHLAAWAARVYARPAYRPEL